MSSDSINLNESISRTDESLNGISENNNQYIHRKGKIHRHIPNFKVTRETLFGNTDKSSIWELFINKFFEFDNYPSENNLEDEVRSLFFVIKAFEDWKSETYPINIGTIDFFKLVERHTLHFETQDCRVRAIKKYKEINKGDDILTKNVSSIYTEAGQKYEDVNDCLIKDPENEDRSVCEFKDSASKFAIDDLLKSKKEMALHRRRLLLSRKVIN